MELGSFRSFPSQSEWSPHAFSDRDWLLLAADRLLYVTKSVADADSFEELLRVVSEACIGIGGAESAGVYLLEEDGLGFTVGWEATVPGRLAARAAGDRLRVRDWHAMVQALESGHTISWQRNDDFLSDFERGHYAKELVGSGIDLPLICRGDAIGFLKLLRHADEPWSARDITIVSMIGPSIALALASELLLARAIQQSLDQSALASIAQVAITPREPRELLQRVAEQIRTLLPFPCVDIELWSPDLDRAEIIAHAARDGWPGPTEDVTYYRLSEWPSDLRLLRELAFFTHDVDDDLPEIERRYFERRNLAQLHYVPLLYGERCLGCIVLHDDVRVDFDQRLHRLVSDVAAITALAANSAHSIRDTAWERRAQDWQLRVNRMVLNDAQIGAVLDEALASTVDLTDVSIAIADLVEPDTEVRIERRVARSEMPLGLDWVGPAHGGWPVVQEAAEKRLLLVRRIGDESVGVSAVPGLLGAGLETIVVVPLVHDSGFCGTLTLLFRARPAMGEVRLGFLRQLARQLALVATNQQLRIEQQYTARRAAVMLKVSQAAVGVAPPSQLLKEIAQIALEIDQVDACEIERYDPRARTFMNETIAFAGDWNFDYDDKMVHPSEDLPAYDRALESLDAVSYLMSDPDVGEEERDAFLAIGVNSVLIVPLSNGLEPVGALSLMRRAAVPFSARTVALANELGIHASIAIGRAHLFNALRVRADSDGVTGLVNHRAILERMEAGLEETARTDAPLSVMLIDLDRFKLLNDVKGHLTGDRYLREIATLIQETIGERGEAARYGGDEFLVLLPGCGADECASIALELLERCQSAEIALEDGVETCRFSVGTATAPIDGSTRDDLIRHADRAMYEAKQQGGGRVGSSG